MQAEEDLRAIHVAQLGRTPQGESESEYQQDAIKELKEKATKYLDKEALKPKHRPNVLAQLFAAGIDVEIVPPSTSTKDSNNNDKKD